MSVWVVQERVFEWESRVWFSSPCTSPHISDPSVPLHRVPDTKLNEPGRSFCADNALSAQRN